MKTREIIYIAVVILLLVALTFLSVYYHLKVDELTRIRLKESYEQVQVGIL